MINDVNLWFLESKPLHPTIPFISVPLKRNWKFKPQVARTSTNKGNPSIAIDLTYHPKILWFNRPGSMFNPKQIGFQSLVSHSTFSISPQQLTAHPHTNFGYPLVYWLIPVAIASLWMKTASALLFTSKVVGPVKWSLIPKIPFQGNHACGTQPRQKPTNRWLDEHPPLKPEFLWLYMDPIKRQQYHILAC